MKIWVTLNQILESADQESEPQPKQYKLRKRKSSELNFV